MQLNHKINIAGIVIDIYVDRRFNNIEKFINNFKTLNINNRNVTAIIYISKGIKRKVELSRDWSTLSITGDKIDNLTDPFNLIGITQAIFRFAAIHLAKRGVFLLHGSAAALDSNRIICFGDDGSSTAKTLGSLEIAFKTNRYVADEFCFINIKTCKIFGYPFIPIHIRPVVRKHLETCHNLTLPTTNYKKLDAGDFIQPTELFRVISGKLKMLLYVHFSETKNVLENLSQKKACKAFKFCVASHIAKLLNPKLDRMQFVFKTDSIAAKVISENTINDIIEKIFDHQSILEAIQKFPSYKLTISQPCQIVSLLKTEI